MPVIVVVPPEPVVTWAELDAHLRLSDDTSQQAEVLAMAAAATRHIDGPTGWLRRAIGLQTLEAHLTSFDQLWPLPCPPFIEMESIAYLDSVRAFQTLPQASYELIADRIVPSVGTKWPVLYNGPHSLGLPLVKVRYKAGYQNIPPDIRAAILLMTEDLYRHRGSVSAGGVSGVPMSTTVESLLATYRVWR